MNLNEDSILNFVDSYRGKTAKKISNPYVFGALAILYAYKGKLGKFERTILGIAGAVTIYSNYKEIEETKKADGILAFLESYATGAVSDKVDDSQKPESEIESLLPETLENEVIA